MSGTNPKRGWAYGGAALLAAFLASAAAAQVRTAAPAAQPAASDDAWLRHEAGLGDAWRDDGQGGFVCRAPQGAGDEACPLPEEVLTDVTVDRGQTPPVFVYRIDKAYLTRVLLDRQARKARGQRARVGEKLGRVRDAVDAAGAAAVFGR